MNYEELINGLYNMESGVEFSLNMSMRAFIQWFLDLPFYVVLIAVFLIISLSFLFKFLYNNLNNN